jgi:hypothetical protein
VFPSVKNKLFRQLIPSFADMPAQDNIRFIAGIAGVANAPVVECNLSC